MGRAVAAFESVELPKLAAEDLERLRARLPVLKQQRRGGVGSGLVVVDVAAPASIVMDCLRSFEDYAQMIPVVRKVDVTARGTTANGVTFAKANYKISKFWIPVSCVHAVHEASYVVHFDLDESAGCTVLKEASGFWHVEQSPGDQPENCRVWLVVELRAAALLPHWLIDYAAERALRRATSWLQPHVERLWHQMRTQRARRLFSEVTSQSPSCHHWSTTVGARMLSSVV